MKINSLNRILSMAIAMAICLSLCIPTFADYESEQSETTLESVVFSEEELEEIARTNSRIQNYMSTRVRLDSGDYARLPMSPIRQENGHFCGPATACMVAETLGLGTYTQKNMAKIIHTNDDGSSSQNICDGMNSLLSASGRSGRYQKTNMSLSNLSASILYSIQHSFPVIVNVKKMPQYEVEVGHFIAVNGFRFAFFGSSSTSKVFLCDPHPTYCGSYTYDMTQLERACSSAVGNFVRLG